ncbi:hypothetical protein SSAG_01248 [Streptomyces sp. Mg1]|nr:hypothetical protein SSAG_01248 [Streptomyces sp. Mg1]
MCVHVRAPEALGGGRRGGPVARRPGTTSPRALRRCPRPVSKAQVRSRYRGWSWTCGHCTVSSPWPKRATSAAPPYVCVWLSRR